MESFNIWNEFYSVLQDKPRFLRLLRSRRIQFQWAALYELQVAELIALLLFALDDDGSVRKGLFEAEDKQEYVIQLGEDAASDDDVTPIRVKTRKILTALALLQVLLKSIEAIQYYSLSMDELVAKASMGNEDALVRAVSIDPTVLNCPPIAHRFSLAVVSGDKKLLRRISKAFQGPHKGKLPNRQLRYVQRILDEAGAFQSATRSHIFEVVATKLGLYEQMKGDPKKGLDTLFARWKADAAT